MAVRWRLTAETKAASSKLAVDTPALPAGLTASPAIGGSLSEIRSGQSRSRGVQEVTGGNPCVFALLDLRLGRGYLRARSCMEFSCFNITSQYFRDYVRWNQFMIVTAEPSLG